MLDKSKDDFGPSGSSDSYVACLWCHIKLAVRIQHWSFERDWALFCEGDTHRWA